MYKVAIYYGSKDLVKVNVDNRQDRKTGQNQNTFFTNVPSIYRCEGMKSSYK